MVISRYHWVFPDYLPLTDALNGWWQVRVGDGTHGNRVGLLNSNSETYRGGGGGFHGYLYAVQL